MNQPTQHITISGSTPEPLHTRVAARAAQLRRSAHLEAQEGKVDAREWNWMVDTAALLEEVGAALRAEVAR